MKKSKIVLGILSGLFIFTLSSCMSLDFFGAPQETGPVERVLETTEDFRSAMMSLNGGKCCFYMGKIYGPISGDMTYKGNLSMDSSEFNIFNDANNYKDKNNYTLGPVLEDEDGTKYCKIVFKDINSSGIINGTRAVYYSVEAIDGVMRSVIKLVPISAVNNKTYSSSSIIIYK